MSSDTRRQSRRDVNIKILEDLEDDVINEVEDFAADTSKPIRVRTHVLGQVKDLLDGVVMAGYTQPGALVATPVTAFGTAIATRTDALTDKVAQLARRFGKSPEETLTELDTMFSFLTGAPTAADLVKFTNMGRIARDELAIDVRSGQTKAELERDQARTDLDARTADRDSEKSRADTLQQQLDAALAAGDPVALKAERDTARTEKTTLQAAIDDVKSHSRPSRTKATDKVTDSAVLQGTTKTAFGWT